MAEIGTMVEQLAGYRIDDGVTHPPLLLAIRRAVYGDLGRTVGGARAMSSIPLVAAAFTLWKELSAEVAGAYSQWTGLPAGPSTIVNLHGWHAAYRAAVDRAEVEPVQVEVVIALLTDWLERIDAFFDAPPVIELPYACPHCGQYRARWGQGELEVESSAIAVTFTKDGMSAVCRTPKCVDLQGEKSQWDGPTEITYMARRMGIDVDQLADKIRAAKEPTAAPDWKPDEGKVIVTPEDESYAAERALLGEAS